MPVILPPWQYARWLGDEADPHDLLRPFPSEAMRMWPISTRVNKPENDDASILDAIELSAVHARAKCFRDSGEVEKSSGPAASGAGVDRESFALRRFCYYAGARTMRLLARGLGTTEEVLQHVRL